MRPSLSPSGWTAPLLAGHLRAASGRTLSRRWRQPAILFIHCQNRHKVAPPVGTSAENGALDLAHVAFPSAVPPFAPSHFHSAFSLLLFLSFFGALPSPRERGLAWSAAPIRVWSKGTELYSSLLPLPGPKGPCQPSSAWPCYVLQVGLKFQTLPSFLPLRLPWVVTAPWRARGERKPSVA
ncbi:hypothetical protein MHYP_G00303160 [Metynnis hypsauchen]